MSVLEVRQPQGAPVPLILDSPHSGSVYPETFDHRIDRMTLRRSEDAHVEELFADAPNHGATLLHALFPRCYIDPNRAADDIDLGLIDGTWPHPVRPTTKTRDRGVGLIWRDMKAFGPVYARKLTVDDVAARIETYWQPYHDTLSALIDAAHGHWGQVLHLNCHSMASMGDRTTEDGAVARPDFVISDREGRTAAPDILAAVLDPLKSEGYSVAINDPYKGFELVRKHGRPAEGRHSVQIEINRALYMDEATLSKTPGFFRVKRTLSGLGAALAETITRRAAAG